MENNLNKWRIYRTYNGIRQANLWAIVPPGKYFPIVYAESFPLILKIFREEVKLYDVLDKWRINNESSKIHPNS